MNFFLKKFYSHQLTPFLTVKSKNEFDQNINLIQTKNESNIENYHAAKAKSEPFKIKGYCLPCDKKVHFKVDFEYGATSINGLLTPNWRERLVCPQCQLNNRQRLMAGLLKKNISPSKDISIYFMEQVTPIFNWATSKFKTLNLIGSEYLGENFIGGKKYNGIRHEDITKLSFKNESFDYIVSNEVFEHVNSPLSGLKECYRVLKKGGKMIITVPFFLNKEHSITRAEILNNKLIQHLPEVYHGNPISEKGSLVFTDFGWDFLDLILSAGFSDTYIDFYKNIKLGHFGSTLFTIIGIR